jgi:ATP-binding cassette subfamily C (CFTR/MRP) protein 4
MLLQMGDVAQWSTRQSAEVTNQMVSVERLQQYTMLPSEAPLQTPADLFIEDHGCPWPTHGTIEVHNLHVRYRPTLPLTLVNITFVINAGEHVAIVGRTGSGKSTLVQSFLRLLEAEEGRILIDGIDISTLGLHRLRKGVTVINQSPTLYGSVSLRENLDPLGKCSEEEIKQALSDVQMMDTVDQLYGGLETMVSEGGSNFSVGQRQLLCLARAILWKSKILILDEPTANVDRETECYIQEAIQKRFNEATIISIAHRLDTIIDCDKVLVLGNGQVLEFGCPMELLEKNGSFASLIDETGAEMAQQLRHRAYIHSSRRGQS